jgi:hypothetical protein
VNFVRSFFTPTLVLALSLGATACKKDKPDGTNPPDGNTGGSVAGNDGGGDGGGGDGGGGADGGGADGGGAGDGGGEKPKSCDAKTADAPTPLFGEQVFIRPPVNVTLAEENPTMAVGHVSGGFVSACDATVDRMTLLVFEHDKAKTPKDFAADFIDHYLHKGGYTGGTKSDPIVDTKTDYDISVEYPAQGGAPASVLYIAVKQRHKNFFAIVYQTRPDEYPILKPTFQASAGTLLVKPPT